MWLRERMQYIFATELNFHESNFLEFFYHMKIFRLFSECYILNIMGQYFVYLLIISMSILIKKK